MIQKYLFWRVLSHNHPCFNNLRPVYIGSRDGNHKTSDSKEYLYMNRPNNGSGPSLYPEILKKPEFKQESATPENKTQKIQLAFPAAPDCPVLTEKSNILEPVIKLEENRTIKINNGRKTRYNAEELLHHDTSQDQDIVEDLIPVNEITLFAGPGGSGKSLLIMQLCLSIVKGATEFIGKKIKTKHHTALVIATEDNVKRLAERIQDQNGKVDGDSHNIKNLVIQITGENLINLLRKELNETKFDIIVLDALGDLLHGDINSQNEVRVFFESLEQLIREFSCTFVVVHHEGKAPNRIRKNKIIGSVAVVDRPRSVLMISKDQKTGIRTLTIEKSNNISDDKIGKPIKLKLDPDSRTFSIAGDYDVTADIDSETSLVAELNKKQQTNSASRSVKLQSRKKKPGRKRDDEKIKLAKELKEKGYNIDEIAKIVKRNRTTVWRWLKEETN